MIFRRIFLLATLLCANSPLVAADSILGLRQELVDGGANGVMAAKFLSLSDRALTLANSLGERGKFWNAIGFVAELCEAGPYDAVLDIRARAVSLLVKRFTDTGRWSALVSSRFAPVLGRIPREFWRREIKNYSDVLDALIASTKSERIRAELYYAQALPWIQINRRWEWLTKEDRAMTLQLLKNIQNEYGALPCPGSRGDVITTVGERAAAHEFELQRLHFRAKALSTVGNDLSGDAIDISDYKGKIVLLDFWTSFCTPCLAMVPDTLRLLAKLQNEPVVYIGVNGDSTRKQGLRTAKRLNMTWRNFWDGSPDGPIATSWRVTGSPTLFVIDGAGRIRYKFRGKEQIDAGVESAITTLLDVRRKKP